MIFGQPTFACETVNSTQTRALELVRAVWPPGTVVTAKAQTEGRGRRGASWHGEPGAGVYMTAIGEAIHRDLLWQLAPLAGLAVAEAIRSFVPKLDPRVRFPNDVLVQGKKIAGVLIESTQFDGETIPLIGIGVNVRSKSLPDSLSQSAVCLQDLPGGATVTVNQVEHALVESLNQCWGAWRGGENFGTIAAAWNARLAPDAVREFRIDGVAVRCRVLSMEADGGIHLVSDDRVGYKLPAAAVILGDA